MRFLSLQLHNMSICSFCLMSSRWSEDWTSVISSHDAASACVIVISGPSKRNTWKHANKLFCNREACLDKASCHNHLIVVLLLNVQTINICLFLLLFFLPGRPDPPTDLELTDQKKRSIQLTWIPGEEHNSPIQGMCGSMSLSVMLVTRYWRRTTHFSNE